MAKNTLKQVQILEVGITSTTNEQVLNNIQEKIEKKEKFYIVTPNPEQLLLASDDQLFKDILNSAEFSIPDGIGLVAAYKYNQLPRPKNIIKRVFMLLKQGFQVGLAVVFDQKWLQSELKLIKGRKLFEQMLIQGDKKGFKCVFVGDDKSSAQKAASKIRDKLSHLQIHAFTGPNLDKDGNLKKKSDSESEEALIKKISKINPDILFIGFGSPKQEKWLYRNIEKLEFSCAAMVGGTLDYFSGTRKSVPRWIEDFNFEWLYRLFTGSQKPGRVFAAFPQFAFRVFLNKLVNR